MRKIEKSLRRETFEADACLVPQIGILGWSRFFDARYPLAEHTHRAAYEICYIVHGKVDWWAAGKVYEVGPQEIFVTRPDEPHGGVDSLMHPCELYWVQVLAARMRGAGWTRIEQGLERMRSRVFAGPARVADIFERLMVEHRTPAEDSAALTQVLLQFLLLEVLRANGADLARQHAEALSPPIRKAVRRMQELSEQHYALDEIAGFVGLGLTQFHARFAQQTGFTPGQYRTRLRIERAKRDLRDGELTVTEIAHRLGFPSSQYFATTFRRYTGMTPGKYRQRVAVQRAAE